MKKASLIKKIASLIIFVAFYFLSIATSHFPYPENAENPTLSFIMSALALLSFYLLAITFCKSKKFLIIVSIFFALVTCCFTCLLFEIDDFLFSHIILTVPVLVYSLPLGHFDIVFEKLFEIINIDKGNDYIGYVHIGIVAALFYATYFISRKIANRKTKKQMQ